jgi:site-specific recombinase XerD
VRVLKVFSSWLYSEGYIDENRLKTLKLPKAPEIIVEPMTNEETRIVIETFNEKSPCGTRNKSIAELMNDTGLRAQEVATIKLADINLDKGYVKVMGKGGKERIVPIGRVVQRSLLKYVTIYRPKPKADECDNLFLSPSGAPITVNTIKLLFSRLAKASGVLRLHAHLCRHTFAINYLLNGGDIFSLQAILGHSTLDMVKHYLHFTSAQVAAQHHKYSPMDKLYDEQLKAGAKDASAAAK